MSTRVYLDGRVVPPEQALVPVFDRGFLYGDSVFEALRTFAGRPFALREHLERLARSATAIAIAAPPLEEIERAVRATLEAAGEPDAYVRIVLTRGAGELGLDPALADRPRLVVIVRAVMLPAPEHYARGCELAIVDLRRGAGAAIDPQVKSGNYLVSVMALAQARRRGAYEALMCDGAGRLAEGASSSLFVVRGGRVSTPPLEAGILEGITRRAVLTLCAEAGIPAAEEPLWPDDLFGADEAFITSSVRGVVPVARVDGRPVGAATPGPTTARVMAAYARLTGGSPPGARL